MGRYLKYFVVALVAVGLMAGSAFAGTLASTTVKIAKEAAASALYKDGSGAAAGTVNGVKKLNPVSYTLGASYVNNDVITFTLSNGSTFKDASYFLVTDANTNTNTFVSNPNGKTPFGQISGGSGSATVTFRVTDDTAQVSPTGVGSSSALVSGTKYYLVSAANATSGGAFNNDVNPTVTVSSLATAGTITMTVNSTTSTSLALDTSGTLVQTVVQSYQQFGLATVSTLFDGVIDVTQARLKFTAGTANNNGGTNVQDKASISVVSDASSNIGTAANYITATATSGGSMVLVISGDMTGIASMKVYTGATTVSTCVISTATTPNTATCTMTDVMLKALYTGGDWGGANQTLTFDVYANVTGAATALATRTFTATSLVYTLGATAYGGTVLTLTPATTSAGTWTVNGYYAIVPYVSGRGDYTTTCIINNMDTSSADVFIDVLSALGGTSATTSNVALGSVPTKSVRRVDLSNVAAFYDSADVAGANIALGSVTQTDRWSAGILVAVPQTNVTVTCFQATPGTAIKRNVNVLVDGTTGTGGTGPKWRN